MTIYVSILIALLLMLVSMSFQYGTPQKAYDNKRAFLWSYILFGLGFGGEFIYFFAIQGLDYNDPNCICAFAIMLFWASRIWAGHKDLGQKTSTGVISRRNSETVGKLEGGNNWIPDEGFHTGTNPDGNNDETYDLQKLFGEIEVTPWYPTKEQGVLAQPIEIKYRVELIDSLEAVKKMQKFAGSLAGMLEQIKEEIFPVLKEKIADSDPIKNIMLDPRFQKTFSKDMMEKLNAELEDEEIPCRFVDFKVGDVILPEWYVTALAEKKKEELDQNALDLRLKKTRARAKTIEGTGTPAEKLMLAMINDGTVKTTKEIQEKAFKFDSETVTALGALAKNFKN